MEDRGEPDAGLTLRALARLGVDEGVPAYIAALAVILLLFVLSALR